MSNKLLWFRVCLVFGLCSSVGVCVADDGFQVTSLPENVYRAFLETEHLYDHSVFVRNVPLKDNVLAKQHVILLSSNFPIENISYISVIPISGQRSWESLVLKLAGIFGGFTLSLCGAELLSANPVVAKDLGDLGVGSYFLADSLVRRSSSFMGSYAKYFFPLGYYSTQSEAKTALLEIANKLRVSDILPADMVLIVKERLYQSVVSDMETKLSFKRVL